MTERPTAPRPQTATEQLALKFGLLKTAPHPVETPQPSKHICLGSAAVLILASEIEARTLYSEKVEHPIKWYMTYPSKVEKRDVPSGITPLP